MCMEVPKELEEEHNLFLLVSIVSNNIFENHTDET